MSRYVCYSLCSKVCLQTSYGTIALSSYSTDAVSFIDKEGAELFLISTDKTGSYAYDTVYIKDNNSVVAGHANNSIYPQLFACLLDRCIIFTQMVQWF
jgi:hypothetical protein